MGKFSSQKNVERSDHGIDLLPLAAQLPWATGIRSCRQSKYWELCLDTTRTLLEHFAADPSAAKVFRSGVSLAEMSRQELGKKMEDGWVKFAPYFFSDSDPKRMRILAVLMVFIFIFDEFWEMHDASSFNIVYEQFIVRMKSGFTPPVEDRTPLLLLIDQIMAEIKELDNASGHLAGRLMLDEMVAFFSRPPPSKAYENMEDFLLYRHKDAAIDFVLACTAFSLDFPIDIRSPKLARYYRLVKDHVSIANDLGSWAKEKRAYDRGQVLYLINTVDAIKNFLRLETENAAIAMAYALQLQVETQIDDEIEYLIAEDSLTDNEWRFIDATLLVLSGNVMASIVMSRYGGEENRLMKDAS
ncbi:uncharacterized protein N7479_003395 [Penicillium vulpinum]|nr:uncharacterized protein N7479_003395 [Penicillium vulpinum]KAJ5963519.1 hypothetical protein N7479_003395 [Penicillium vulpinum]